MRADGEIAPGFRCPTLAHARRSIRRSCASLGLERHGLRIVRSASTPARRRSTAARWSCGTTPRARPQQIRAFSAKDAEQYPRFLTSFARISGVLRAVAAAAPPSIDDPGAADLIELLQSRRGVSRARQGGRATGCCAGCRWRSPTSSANGSRASRCARRSRPAASSDRSSVRGRPAAPRCCCCSARAKGIRSRAAGSSSAAPARWPTRSRPRRGRPASRFEPASRSRGSRRPTAPRPASRSRPARRSRARAVVSNLDPKRTLLGLVDPMHLEPEFVRRVQNIRAHGTLAKVNYAVSALPRFAGLAALGASEQAAALSGRIRLAPQHRRHRARVRRREVRHLRGRAVDRADDPVDRGSGARAARRPCRLGLRAVRAVPPARHQLGRRARSASPIAATRTIAHYAPGFESSIVAREVITPLDLERKYGLTGGHIFHGELSLDQWFVTRPLLGWAQLPHADREPVSLRIGDASRHRPGWAFGRAGGARDVGGESGRHAGDVRTEDTEAQRQ